LGGSSAILIITDLPSVPQLGREMFVNRLDVAAGGSLIAAAAMHYLGPRVGLLIDLRNAFFSQAVARLIEEEELDTTLIRCHSLPLA
jgi:hypothetical protein